MAGSACPASAGCSSAEAPLTAGASLPCPAASGDESGPALAAAAAAAAFWRARFAARDAAAADFSPSCSSAASAAS